MKEKIWQHVLAVREKSPLVQNITNYVVMNNSANALLAIGASPIMAHAHPEIKNMAAICQSIVINIGTLEEYWVESMLMAAQEANNLNKPWILDPVGAGATSYRNEVLEKLVALRPTIIRGNASEILSLAKYSQAQTKGVDSTFQSTEAVDAAIFLNKTFGAIVCISGAIDIIVSGSQKAYLSNGDPLMTKVTGLGCSSTAVIGAFAAIIENKFEATIAAMSLFSIAGEIAAKNSLGPGSLQLNILDKLYNMNDKEFMHHIQLNID